MDPGAAPGQQCSPGFSRRSLELSHFTFPKPATAVERTPNNTLQQLLLPAFSNSQNQNTFHLEQEYILPETEIHFTLFDYSRVFQMFLQMMNWFLKPTLLKVMYPHLIKVSQKYTFSDLKSFSPRRLILRFQQRLQMSASMQNSLSFPIFHS